ncbi:hypothetical protein HPP92_008471 [Vanilla planifolia]|uniref:Uncharacterized protein n=1 Tax=Vanilla planifolia TaxID=51239 RepID=A0A835REE0_VANPL|nr:hypothetical protein HPP92_008471 [Vanilla planifolia]
MISTNNDAKPEQLRTSFIKQPSGPYKRGKKDEKQKVWQEEEMTELKRRRKRVVGAKKGGSSKVVLKANLVTVTGTMDVSPLPGHLRKRRHGVEIVPAKKVDSSAWHFAATFVGDGGKRKKSDEKGREGGEGREGGSETVVTSTLTRAR